MENSKVLEVYRRYLNSLQDKNANIGKNYKSIEDYLVKNTDDQVCEYLRIHCMFVTIRTIKQRGINCKSESKGEWNSTAVQEAYKRMDRVNNVYEDESSSIDQLRVLTLNLMKFMEDLLKETPWTYLYLLQVYSEKSFGVWLSIPSKCDGYKVIEKWLKSPDTFGDLSVLQDNTHVTSDETKTNIDANEDYEYWRDLVISTISGLHTFEELSTNVTKLREDIFTRCKIPNVINELVDSEAKKHSDEIMASMATTEPSN